MTYDQGYPPAYGGPPPPPYGAPEPPPPPPPRRRRWVFVVAGVAVIVVAAATVAILIGRGLLANIGGVNGSGATSDEAQIRQVIIDFADALDHADQEKMISLLCAEEAEQLMADDDYDPDAVPVDGVVTRPVDVLSVHIDGDVASAEVKRASPRINTLWLIREAGSWKLCDSAGDPEPTVEPSPSVSPSPPL